MAKKNVMVSNNMSNRTFDHAIGTVGIRITLRTDIKQELKDGKAILETIIKEIDEELAKK